MPLWWLMTLSMTIGCRLVGCACDNRSHSEVSSGAALALAASSHLVHQASGAFKRLKILSAAAHQSSPTSTVSVARIQPLCAAQLGAYNTVNFFRVDKGFVLQCTDIVGNRLVPLDARQQVSTALLLGCVNASMHWGVLCKYWVSSARLLGGCFVMA